MTVKDYKNYEDKAEEFYQQYAIPLEAKHAGEYLAVSHDGKQTLLEETLVKIVKKAKSMFGSENFIFKIGTRSIGTWR